MNKSLACLVTVILSLCLSNNPVLADPSPDYEYQLYENMEDFGIVIFPKEGIFPELEQYIQSINFKPVESGKAVMRSGPNGEGSTYMMPQDVQDRYSIKKFIILQVLSDNRLVAGIFDPDWGLTILPDKFQLDDIRENIRETLNIFRRTDSFKKINWKPRNDL
ncbi:MAG: hypothetical protein AAB014_00935 [Nitrospirota bacterium]